MKVRDVIRLIQSDGWLHVGTKGSHRQYKHPRKRGRVTVPGHLKYGVVIESGANNYSAYVPDLPGCVSTGRTLEEVQRNIKDAIEFHLEGMREDGEPIPQPSTRCEYVEATSAEAR